MPSMVRCYVCNEMVFTKSVREHYEKRHNMSREDWERYVIYFVMDGNKVALDIMKRYHPRNIFTALPYLIADSFASLPRNTDLDVEQFLHDLLGVVRIILSEKQEQGKGE